MNISFCWLDYKEKNPDGYEKSQFYEYFNRFIAENYGGQKVSMAVNRVPGEKMYIETIFREKSEEGEYLYWYSIQH